MNFLFPLFNDAPYFEWPSTWMGWLLFLVWVGALLYILWNDRLWQKRPQKWLGYLGAVAAAVVASFLLGWQLPSWEALAFPERPVDPNGAVLLLFAAVPWFWAAGMYGTLWSAVLAFLSGLIIGLWNRHSIFFPLELAVAGALLGGFLRQRYRTPFYRFVRHPLGSALLFSALYPIVFIVDTVVLPNADLATNLNYALSNLPSAWAAMAGMLLIGGIVAEAWTIGKLPGWGARPPWEPSPAERSLGLRFFYTMTVILVALVGLVIAGNWMFAERSARRSLRERMGGVVEIATRRVPFFLETGQSLLLEWAQDERLWNDTGADIRQVLETDMHSIPFFTELALVNWDGATIAAFPDAGYDLSTAPLEESMAVELALQGVAIQSYPVAGAGDEDSAEVVFVAALQAEEGDEPRGALIGRTVLSVNPLMEPVLSAFEDIRALGGGAYLLDENNDVLYSTIPSLAMSVYDQPLSPDFGEVIAPDGTRRLLMTGTAEGRPWKVVVWVPLRLSQELALQTAGPLAAMMFLFAVVMALILRVMLRLVTSSLRTLGEEAEYIASGNLERPLQAGGVDEVGQLRQSFEEMRQSLKARLDELNRLLLVSQGVASTLEIEEAMLPVLNAAIEDGASAARIVLLSSLLPGFDREISVIPNAFGVGESSDTYAYLDLQILELTRRQKTISLTNPGRLTLLRFPPDARIPGSLLAFALYYESTYYGVMWVAHDEPHVFSQDEKRFFETLAGQASLAASNARLFRHSEVERQRLAAILDSTPDPVLVTDHKNRLLLVNPVARRVLDLADDSLSGVPIERVLHQPELVSLLRSSALEKQSAEAALPDGRVYLAIASPIRMDEALLGRVCVLRDVTHFKELDALKTEFVSTVSHDLRSPLTLMRGYTTMLEMVGNLNEQQIAYIRKISKGIESMSRLVNNLLDLGRIEAGVGLMIEKVPAQEIVDNVIEGLQLRAEHKQIDLRVQLPKEPLPIIEADRALLQQALHNLVENAIKYTQPGGWVEVQVSLQPESLLFTVSDNGIGIAPVDQARLFERFYRVARRGHIQERGTGLGLAIVKSIAERHGGRVWVKSQLGEGSTFYLLVPLKQDETARPFADS